MDLRATSRFSESEQQSKLSERLEKLAVDSAMADYLDVADYIEQHPSNFEDYYTRAYNRREQGASHAVLFRQYAIHSPAQRRKSRTSLCRAGDIELVRGSPSLIEWLEVTDEQIQELQEIWSAYQRRVPIGFEPIAPTEPDALTHADLSAWIRK